MFVTLGKVVLLIFGNFKSVLLTGRVTLSLYILKMSFSNYEGASSVPLIVCKSIVLVCIASPHFVREHNITFCLKYSNDNTINHFKFATLLFAVKMSQSPLFL